MKLMKELLEAKEPTGKCVVVYNMGESMEAYDIATEIFKVFGYKDVATLYDYITPEEAEDYFSTGADQDLLTDVGVWAPSKPSKDQVIKSLDMHGVVVIGG